MIRNAKSRKAQEQYVAETLLAKKTDQSNDEQKTETIKSAFHPELKETAVPAADENPAVTRSQWNKQPHLEAVPAAKPGSEKG